MTTLMLVHGAWHGAWCWDKIRTRLDAAGVASIALDLPGHGASGSPLGDLVDDTDSVSRAIDAVDGPVVLVGHSYGGAVITGAGVHDRVRELVYLTSFPLAEGEPTSASAAEDNAHDEVSLLPAALVFSDDGTQCSLTPDGAIAALYDDCRVEDAQWAVSRIGPQSLSSLSQPPTAVAWLTKPSTYAICTLDRAVPPTLQRRLAARCTRTVEWESGHSPFLSQPDVVAELLVAVARGA
jgi:pimeloyl-ACP methyl ester carboxylesterase